MTDGLIGRGFKWDDARHLGGFHFSNRRSKLLSSSFKPAPNPAMITIGTNMAAIWKRCAATELK